MNILRQHQGGNLDTLQLVQVGKQADVQQDDQKAQPQTSYHTTAPSRSWRSGQATNDRQHGKAHGDIEGCVEQATQSPVRHFSAKEGDDRHFSCHPVQLFGRTCAGDNGINHDRQHQHQQERHDRTDQIDDALDVQTQGADHQHGHQDGTHQRIQTKLLSEGRARAGKHDHAHAVQEERQNKIDNKTRLLAENDVEHLLMRSGLHDGADTGDLHAQEGKEHGRYNRSCNAGNTVTGEKLQYFVTRGKATTDNHGHVRQGNLPGVFVHLTYLNLLEL